MSKIFNSDGVKLACLKNEGLHSPSFIRAREVIVEVLLTLIASVGDLADFLRVESLPRLSVQVLVEGNDKDRVHEIDESVSNIAVVLQINWQVEKVVAAGMELIDFLKEHLLRVLVGDVSDHDRSARIFTSQNTTQVDCKSINFITIISFSLINELLWTAL